jgi:hypothetical protein
VPLVALKKEHYQHKSYGRIFTPIFEVTGWASLDSAEAPEAVEDAVDEEVATEAPRRRRRA